MAGRAAVTPGRDRAESPAGAESRPRPWRPAWALAAAGLLAAGIIVWSAAPLRGGAPGTRAALLIAAACAVLTVGQLALARAHLGSSQFAPDAERAARRIALAVRSASWPEGLVIAALALEALHRSRPWHTVVLTAALVAFLLAVHCAETTAPAGVLAPQLPLLAAAFGLAVLAGGATALPALGTGPGSVLLRVLAAVAAVLAGLLAVPA